MRTFLKLLLLEGNKRIEMLLQEAKIEIFGYRSITIYPEPKSYFPDPDKKNKYCEYILDIDPAQPIILDFGNQKLVHIHFINK